MAGNPLTPAFLLLKLFLFYPLLTVCKWVCADFSCYFSGTPHPGGLSPHFFGVHLLDPSNKNQIGTSILIAQYLFSWTLL